MKIKLFLDEDVQVALAQALRKRGYDVVHAQELNFKGKSDSAQLRYAVKQKRCLLSYNVKDFVLEHNEYILERKKPFWHYCFKTTFSWRNASEAFENFTVTPSAVHKKSYRVSIDDIGDGREPDQNFPPPD